MDAASVDTDILIVGAGPVGLFLANECARHGLRARIVETNPGQSRHSKALAIFPRTLEILDMAGLVERFLEVANRVSSVAVASHGRSLAHMRFAPQHSPYPFIAMVPQDVTERLLVEALACKGRAVEYETRLESAAQNGDRVDVRLSCNGRPLNLTASYVVGCDGAHSAVRHLLGLPFEGRQYDSSFMLADVEVTTDLPADELQLCPNEAGPIAIFPMSATRRRIVAVLGRADAGSSEDAPSMALVQRLLAERAPRGIEAQALHWSSFFRIHHRYAPALRVGRIFIAGDAAHIHSPFGGQGMNTGLQDIWNLAWKLDLAVRGHGNEALLDSYAGERLPVIRDVIRTTDLLTKAMSTPSRLAQALRDAIIPRLSRLASFQHAFVERLSGLGVTYEGSRIIEGAGERFFDESVRGGKNISGRFLLLDDSGLDDAHVLGQLGEPYRDVVEVRRTSRAGLALVRPDGYVAYANAGGTSAAALRSVRSVLQRQAH